MIIRSSGPWLWLITQPNHAALAGTIMRAWRAGALPAAEARDAILRATRAHDDGWAEAHRYPIFSYELATSCH